MHVSDDLHAFCSRLHTLVRQRRRKDNGIVSRQISSPFDFRHESSSLPGISDDEISMLRDKAAASRIGIADPVVPRAPISAIPSGLCCHPVRPSIKPTLTSQSISSTESLE